MTLWSGRVEDGLAPEVWAFLKADDAELLPYDCAATVIHAQRLYDAGLLSSEELTEVQTALRRIAVDGACRRRRRRPLCDRAAVAMSGGRSMPAGRATIRSRPFRLHVADAHADAALTAFVRTSSRARTKRLRRRCSDTRTGSAQPVTLGHHLLAWVEMPSDRARFAFAGVQAAPSPLGAGALAGRRCRCRRRRTRCATRWTRLLTATSRRLPHAVVLFTHFAYRRGARAWTTSEFAFARLPSSPRPARR
jgi:argininosuccinate lyase